MSALPTPAQLAPALSRAASPLLFALAGRVAAQALVVGTWQRDTDMIRLLDAMERQLPEVVRALSEHVHGPVLVECTGAMAVLALARPHTERGVRQVSRAIVDRTPPSAWIADSSALNQTTPAWVRRVSERARAATRNDARRSGRVAAPHRC